jgi:hypothetical protein
MCPTNSRDLPLLFPFPFLVGVETKFIVPDWGDTVDYGIGLSYLPVRGRIQRKTWDPMKELTITLPYAPAKLTPAHLPWETHCQSRP